METNNPLNPNPEEAEKTVQDENSDQPSEKADKKVEAGAKKAKSPKSKKEVENDKDTIAEAEAPADPPSEAPTAEAEKPAAVKKTDAADQNEPVTEETESPPPSVEATGEEKPKKKQKSKKDKDKVVEAEIPAEQPSDTLSEAPREEADKPPAVENAGAADQKEPVPEKTESLPPSAEASGESKPKKEQEVKEPEEIADLEDDQEDDEDEDHEGSEEATQVNYHDLSMEELVAMLEAMVQEEDISSLRKKVALIKVAFLKKHTSKQEEKLESIAGLDEDDEHDDEEKDDLEQRFDQAFNVYSEKRKAFLDKQEDDKQQNLETKKLILEELKALIESEESLKKTYDDFKDLQEKWKAVGMVPKSEVNNLWQNYHFYVEKFFDKVKINKELRDLDLKKNMEQKIELCEKAEELLLETSILKSFKQLQQYHKQWKDIGPAPQDKKDELWERFRSTTEKINQARRDHYNKLKEEQEANLLSKTTLCEKAEEILQRENNSIKDWQENTREISELLKVWKTIGPAPRKENDDIWDRFKTSLDTFFAGKKEYFQTIKDEQLNNYNLKLDLCAQAEAIKSSTDWKQTTRDLIDLQKEWKKIGPVPRRHSDKIWQRFRAACDEFFNNKSAYFANRKTHESDNLQAKEELIKKVETHEYGKDKSKNLEILKGFQREWTEIGHVPFKDKDKIQNAFRNAIDSKLDELKISKAEMQTITYKQRFENIKDNPNANRIVRNEKYFLQQKMKKLEDEVKLLENNMGFLAQSKKADLLKAEFMKKIEDARTEVEVLKEKIKFLERD